MYETQNGWTKESMKKHVQDNFKGKSTNFDQGCVYRGEEGKKCAVGLFIPDNVYQPEMDQDDSGARRIIPDFNLNKYMPLDIDGMTGLQREHDTVLRDSFSLVDQTNILLSWIDKNVK